MKRWLVGLTWLLAAAVLVSCGNEEATPVGSTGDDTGTGYTSTTLGTSYEDALDVSSQLALGTLELEGTEEAVTADQAATLLPLWQALQGGVTVEAEVNAVLAQIERTMTTEQLQAIAAMQLTQKDIAAWAEENQLAMPGFDGGPGRGQGGGPGGGQGGGSDMTDEERAAIRATMEAGGGPPFDGTGSGGGPFGGQDMTDEERAAIRATMEAGGAPPSNGTGGQFPGGRGNFLIPPLVELLSGRAAER